MNKICPGRNVKSECIKLTVQHKFIDILSKHRLQDNYCVRALYIQFEPVHGISNNVVCASSKASDQPAHTRSLIRAFASRVSIL